MVQSALTVEEKQGGRAIAAISPALDTGVGIVVCIPSFRRPQHLRKTLRSLVAQNTARQFAVLIVENDAAHCESAPVAAEFLHGGKLAGLCVVEPEQGNCAAINAAFGTARKVFPSAEYFLMIDDDEVASEGWLETMLRAAEASDADVVGGPVWPNFADKRHRGLRRHPAFAPAYEKSGPVWVIYGCGNCLIRRRVFERLDDPSFDLRFNFLGGGDYDFFLRCYRLGMRFHWAAEAVITETVPESRTNPRWLLMRSLRIGVINYHVQRKAANTMWSRMVLLARMLAILPLSLWRALRLFVAEHKVLVAMHPVVVAVGTALAAAGVEPQPYKASKIAS